jgi:hypothetical protein
MVEICEAETIVEPMKAEDYLLVSFEETFKGENDPDYC